jgi:hypothetical protein
MNRKHQEKLRVTFSARRTDLQLLQEQPLDVGASYPMRGIVLYRVATLDGATALAAEDPAVKAGRLVLDAHPG